VVFAFLWITVFVVPWEESAVIPYLATLSRTIGAVTLGLALVGVAVQARIRRPPLAYGLLALYVFWTLLSWMWSVAPDLTQERIVTHLLLLLWIWIVWEYATTLEQQRSLMRAFVFGSVVSLVSLLLGRALGELTGSDWYARLTGAGMDENTLAMVLALAVVMAVYLATHPSTKSKVLRIVYWAFVPAAGLGVFLTGSRAGVLCLLVALTMTVLFSRYRGWKTLALTGVCILCGVFLVQKLVAPRVLERVSEGTEAGTYRLRLDLWQAGLERWQKDPLIGVGAAGFRRVVFVPKHDDLVAHNAFIGVLVDLGAVGLVMFGSVVVWSGLRLLRMPKAERLLWLALMMVWGGGAMSLSIEYAKITWLLFAMIFTQAAALRAAAAQLQGPGGWVSAAQNAPGQSDPPPIMSRWNTSLGR
jgi:O-antigen ligase